MLLTIVIMSIILFDYKTTDRDCLKISTENIFIKKSFEKFYIELYILEPRGM